MTPFHFSRERLTAWLPGPRSSAGQSSEVAARRRTTVVLVLDVRVRAEDAESSASRARGHSSPGVAVGAPVRRRPRGQTCVGRLRGSGASAVSSGCGPVGGGECVPALDLRQTFDGVRVFGRAVAPANSRCAIRPLMACATVGFAAARLVGAALESSACVLLGGSRQKGSVRDASHGRRGIVVVGRMSAAHERCRCGDQASDDREQEGGV